MKNLVEKKGFTLVETIVVVSLNALLALVISTSIVNLYQSNGYNMAQSYEIEQARRGLQTWIKDVRELAFADNGTYPVVVTEPHRFGFYSDVIGGSSVEYVEYALSTSTASSTTLYRRVYSASGFPPVYNLTTPTEINTLSEYVQNILQGTSTFSYFDNNGVQLTGTSSLLTDVRYLEAKVIINIDPIRSPGEFLLRSGVAPRNLKDNL
jgi:prepilin-type N-terminal cleavage/methylation domain-containing protein